MIGYLRIAGIEMLDTKESRETGGGSKLQISGIGIDRRAALVAYDASFSDCIGKPIEENTVLRCPAEPNDAGKHSGEGKKAGKGKHCAGGERPDRHHAAVSPRGHDDRNGED